MQNADKSKRVWKMPEVKDIVNKYGAQKPEKATWGDFLYVFAMMYSDYFPKVLRNESDLVKATICYLEIRRGIHGRQNQLAGFHMRAAKTRWSSDSYSTCFILLCLIKKK